ncbi:CheW protein [Thioalkalivibrio sulfidiphilus HL-EbGr7]|uniref:CheW protein n=1 Tax=Thioalkalivibrio sulfidiphilus (strain HL-EbGR7) TaxID=396588 RepID=B8GR11_THISH|nr:chemotaxis protein CheW [Thioalkalivibrio sulfidiphilus]ACL72431.1 CheW protein [Thioalkalivibrio sulfidiphilus HL-EbGr7]
MNPQRDPVLLDEREALIRYLDSLLQEIPEAPQEAEPQTRTEMPVSQPAAVAPVREAPPVAEVRTEVPAPVQAPVVEPAPAQVPSPEAGPPEWGRERFQCLGLRLAGLTLAVPLVKLNGIIEMPEEITPMPGHQPWFLGLVKHLDRQVKVVDIARIVLPEGREYAPIEARHVVLMDDSRWGIACEGITEVMTLEPDAVRWRSSRGKRPWLAGTVIEQMCAILDVDILARDLATGQWSVSAAPAQARRR